MTVHHATAPTATERLRAAWNSAHAPVPGVPRWARVAAYVIPFTVLPSGLWRITTVVFHVGDDGAHGAGQLPSWLPGPVYIVALSIVSELLAFTAIGLIAAWGRSSRTGFRCWAAAECCPSLPSCPPPLAPRS